MPRRVEIISNTGRVMKEGGRITETGFPVFIAPPKALPMSAERRAHKVPQETRDELPMLLTHFTQEALRGLPSGTVDPETICQALNDQKKEFGAPNKSNYRLSASFRPDNKSFYFDYKNGEKSGDYGFGPIALQEVLSYIPHNN